MRLIWTNSWYSPPKETAAAKNLISAGVDVLGQNVDSPAAGVVAESKGIPWVGYDSDARKTRAEAVAHRSHLQLGAVLREAREGGAMNGHVEVGLLLRDDQGRLHGTRSVRAEGEREDEGGDCCEAEGDRLRPVQRLPGPDLRPEREADGQAGRRS